MVFGRLITIELPLFKTLTPKDFKKPAHKAEEFYRRQLDPEPGDSHLIAETSHSKRLVEIIKEAKQPTIILVKGLVNSGKSSTIIKATSKITQEIKIPVLKCKVELGISRGSLEELLKLKNYLKPRSKWLAWLIKFAEEFLPIEPIAEFPPIKERIKRALSPRKVVVIYDLKTPSGPEVFEALEKVMSRLREEDITLIVVIAWQVGWEQPRIESIPIKTIELSYTPSEAAEIYRYAKEKLGEKIREEEVKGIMRSDKYRSLASLMLRVVGYKSWKELLKDAYYRLRGAGLEKKRPRSTTGRVKL